MCAACYLVSYSVLPPHSKSVWFARASNDERKVYMEWIKSANFRASQTGMHSCVNARNYSRVLSSVFLCTFCFNF